MKRENFHCNMASASLQEKAPFLQVVCGGTEVSFSSSNLLVVHLPGTSPFFCPPDMPSHFLQKSRWSGFQANGFRMWYWLVNLRKLEGVRKGLGPVFFNPEQPHPLPGAGRVVGMKKEKSPKSGFLCNCINISRGALCWFWFGFLVCLFVWDEERGVELSLVLWFCVCLVLVSLSLQGCRFFRLH